MPGALKLLEIISSCSYYYMGWEWRDFEPNKIQLLLCIQLPSDRITVEMGERLVLVGHVTVFWCGFIGDVSFTSSLEAGLSHQIKIVFSFYLAFDSAMQIRGKGKPSSCARID